MNAYITPTLLDSITLNLMKLNIKDNVVHFAIPLLFGGLAYYNLYSAMQAQGEGIFKCDLELFKHYIRCWNRLFIVE